MQRMALVLLIIVAALASGCGASKRPYTNDPLLRNGRGVWGDPERERVAEERPAPEPDAPRPPAPVSLPTLEWETPKQP
jgi:hypothetical protein